MSWFAPLKLLYTQEEVFELLSEYEKARKGECKRLEEENKKLKDKIAKLEFDIHAWVKLKAVWEEKERMLNEENKKLQIDIEMYENAYGRMFE